MQLNKDFVITIIGYFLAIFFNWIGLIYGLILYILKRNKEVYYEHSRNIMAIAVFMVIVRLFTTLAGKLF